MERKSLKGTDMLLTNVEMYLVRHRKNTNRLSALVYVEQEEDRLFLELVLPLARLYAANRKIVICDLNSDITLGTEDYPLILIDAGNCTADELRTFVRLEMPTKLCAYLRIHANPAFIHLRNMGKAKEDFCGYLSMLTEGRFSCVCRTEATNIVLTGVHGQPGINNCLDSEVRSHCDSVCAIEWPT